MRQMPLAVGQIVADRYRVERVLGHGGMGVVVAARHIELDEVFALKVMTPQAFESPESVERFMREARTTAKLKSVHAVKVVDTGRLHDGAPFLAMEYLQGRDLERELAARGPLPVAEAAGYMMQACDVLAEAHALGIVHRDLKPANLFLTRLPNGSTCVKVLDFGIAKNEQAQGPRMTQTSSVFGTPLYMSPEQMRSSKSADPRSDIWSLGVVLYELCTGAVPYDGESMTALVAIVMTELPIPPSRRRPGIGADVEAVIMRCLERDPARRYPTAAALAQALEPIARHPRAAHPELPDASWVHRNTAAGPALATDQWPTAPLQPFAAPQAGPSWGNAGTQSSLTTNASAARARRAVPFAVGAAVIAIASGIGAFLVLRGNGSPPHGTAAAVDAAASTSGAPSVFPAATPPPSAEVAPATASATPGPSGTASAPAASALPSAASGQATGTPRPGSGATAKPAAKPSSQPTANPSGRGGFL